MPSSTWATANVISSLSVSFGGRPGPRMTQTKEIVDLHVQCDDEGGEHETSFGALTPPPLIYASTI